MENLYITPPTNGIHENGVDDASEDDSEIKIYGGGGNSSNSGNGSERRCLARCPASPITIPAAKSRTNSVSQPKSPKPRRQRTTSTSLNTNQNEAIIRSNNRTIYTAGRPPW